MSLKTYDNQGTLVYELDTNKEIARGGEGFLLTVPRHKNIVAKIYHPGCVNITEKKFDYLNKLDEKLFVRPKSLLYEKSGKKIVGITMNLIPNDFYPLDAIFNKNFGLKHNITFGVKEKISKQLTEAVLLAHSHQINIGDLSGLNVLVNDTGDIKLIDVDSYQVPGIPHSNKLLEEIRDYLHGGQVTTNSDFFALSVVIFNYLTHLHPFKGIHNKYNTLAERMIHKKPVFVTDKDLIIPKCYEKLTDKFLTDQFERLYIGGERFLLSLNKVAFQNIGKKFLTQVLSEKEVILQNIFNGETIEYANFNLNLGMIRTAKEFIVFDVSNKGTVKGKIRISRNDFDDVFIGKINIVLLKQNRLFVLNKNATQIIPIDMRYLLPAPDVLSSIHNIQPILNIELDRKARFVHINNYLISIEEDVMRKINLDVVKYNEIATEKIPVYGPGFMIHNGVIQNVGGIQYLHYYTGKNLSVSRLPIISRGVYQQNDVGIIQYEENKKVHFKYYQINNMNFSLGPETDMLYHFAYRGDNLKDGLLFLPKDDKIEVVRAMDFYKLAEIDCSIISSDTRLFNTSSGIIAINENEAWVINKR